MSQNSPAEETNIRIPGDMFRNSMAKLLLSGKIRSGDQDLLVWYYNRAQRLHMSLMNVGDELDMSATDAWRMFLGKLEGYGSVALKLGTLRAAESAASPTSTFVETTIWKKIEQVSDYAAASRKPVFISGVSQIGKTACLEEYRRRNDTGYTKILTVPPKPSFGAVTYELAKLLSLPPRGYNAEIKSRIFDAIDSRTLLIVDEVHQAMQGVPHKNTIGIMEYLRFIHDKCKCGMVFSGTLLFKNEMDAGPLAPILDQFRRRGIVHLVLPEVTPTEDVNDIAASYGLPPPSTEPSANEIVQRLIKSSGVGQYIIYLKSASNLARNQKKPVSWAFFTAAYDLVQALSSQHKGTK